MGKLILPKTYVKDIGAPLIFLAGPIKSAPVWQDDAVEVLFSIDPNLAIASPRWGVRPKIEKYVVEGDDDKYKNQTTRQWERNHLNFASNNGAIMFWLPGEEKHDCKKVYGAMTRVELGEWMTHYSYDKRVRFCVGTDGRFPELRPIKYDLSQDAPEVEIKNTLEETCQEAVRLSRLNHCFD